MRRPERIPIILESLKDDSNKLKVLEKFFKPKEGSQLEIGMPYFEIDTIIKRWDKLFEEFSVFWKLTPDLRLSQALVNCGVMPNFMGFWYYLEDDTIMISTNILEPRDICFWGQNYDENLNRLPQTNWILIKNMSTDHIKAILNDCESNNQLVGSKYLEYFNNEIKLRENDKV